MSICIYVVLYFTILLFILNPFICVSDNNMGILCSLCTLGNILAQLLFVVMFMLFSSNTTGVTSGAETAYPSRASTGLVGFVLLNL